MTKVEKLLTKKITILEQEIQNKDKSIELILQKQQLLVELKEAIKINNIAKTNIKETKTSISPESLVFELNQQIDNINKELNVVQVSNDILNKAKMAIKKEIDNSTKTNVTMKVK